MATATARLRVAAGLGPYQLQRLVQRQDLRPVGLGVAVGLVVDGGDGRLELVGADRDGAKRAGEQRYALLDPGGVPQVAPLLGQGHQGAVGGGPRGAAGVGRSISASSPATSPSAGTSGAAAAPAGGPRW
jgi:hypothetical protein